MTEAPNNVDGEICISGPTVMKGYLNNVKETYNVLKKHSDGKIWLHTGDLGCMDKDGWVYFKQRLKRIIVCNGYCIYPNYIERILKLHEAVGHCVVVGIDDPYRVQKIRAYIILKPDFKHTEEIEKSIREHCKKGIAKYSIPHEFEYIKEFPKTLVGKVSFKTLVSEEVGLEMDPLLVKEEQNNEIVFKIQFKEILNLKKLVERAAKVTRRRINKAMKKQEKEYVKIQKEKIEKVKKNTKKRGE
jgi:acyl-CoA synthetase (AMP-forming)/AMP-acid ligase II